MTGVHLSSLVIVTYPDLLGVLCVECARVAFERRAHLLPTFTIYDAVLSLLGHFNVELACV